MRQNYENRRPYRYPSPADVKLYIGGEWVDDAYRVDYNVSTPRTPLYDYTSKFYKDVAEGHTIVQGQLIINYRFPNYLLAAINKQLFRDPEVLKELSESFNMYREMAEGDSESKVRKLIELKRLGALKPAKQAAKSLYSNQPGTTNRSLDPKAKLEKAVISQKDMVPFNITIKYGGDEAFYSHTIKNCVIIGEGQTISAAALAGGDLSASSLPIYEVYNFFGRKVEADISKKIAGHYGR